MGWRTVTKISEFSLHDTYNIYSYYMSIMREASMAIKKRNGNMNIDSLREKLIFQQSLFSMGSE
jgi:hypothetical protein